MKSALLYWEQAHSIYLASIALPDSARPLTSYYFVNYKRFMGYRYKNGNLEIIPEEAQTIRMIFYMYLMGKTLNQIKDELEKENIKTATGKNN